MSQNTSLLGAQYISTTTGGKTGMPSKLPQNDSTCTEQEKSNINANPLTSAHMKKLQRCSDGNVQL